MAYRTEEAIAYDKLKAAIKATLVGRGVAPEDAARIAEKATAVWRSRMYSPYVQGIAAAYDLIVARANLPSDVALAVSAGPMKALVLSVFYEAAKMLNPAVFGGRMGKTRRVASVADAVDILYKSRPEMRVLDRATWEALIGSLARWIGAPVA